MLTTKYGKGAVFRQKYISKRNATFPELKKITVLDNPFLYKCRQITSPDSFKRETYIRDVLLGQRDAVRVEG
jgi:hypothetical protein